MKKRRVLALLLALSLAVSMNGMTVLAAETGAAESVVMSVEEDGDEVSKEDTETTETGETEENTDTDEKDSEGQKPEDTEQNAGGDSETNPEEVSGEEADEKSDEEQKTEEDSAADETEVTDQEGSEEEIPTEGEETADEEEEAAQAEQEPEENREIKAQAATVRMVTFTDDTGMRITYNANEAAAYEYTVVDHVLTKVEIVEKDEEGNETSRKEVSEGDIVLSQPEEEEEHYTSVAASVFQGKTGITYVKLPAGVTGISDGAFQGCTGLKGVYIPNGVTTIGKSAFEGCTGLTKLSVPKSVTTIDNKAFYGDSKLFMVYMKDADYSALEIVGSEAFSGCKVLSKFCSDTTFLIPGNLKVIGNGAFYDCKEISEVDLNESVTNLGENAFRNCISLRKVTLSSSLEEISQFAFAGCNNLVGVKFNAGNRVIGASAFEGCYNLGRVDLVWSINKIGQAAFKNCSNLLTADIRNGDIVIEEGAFPNVNTLTLIGPAESEVYKYTIGKNIKFLDDRKFTSSNYTYKVQILGEGGGDLIVRNVDGKDPNTLNSKTGVPVETKLYVYPEAKSGYILIDGSVKCNGEEIEKVNAGKYYFEMPLGGALITAEFETLDSSKKTAGLSDQISVEISNGDITKGSQTVVKEVDLKVGQYSQMFLIDSKDDNGTIAASKIDFKSENTAIATISDSGMIHAIKAGTSKITAKVTGGDGNPVTKEIRVNVVASDIASLKIKAVSHVSSKVTLTESPGGFQTAIIDKVKVDEDLSFDLKATAYDETDDNTSAELKWTTSDAKVARLSTLTTACDSPVNTVTIPKGTDGEATITVKATNADKEEITQKFIISVKDYTPRLVSSSLTINQSKSDGELLKIVCAYDSAITTAKLTYTDRDTETSDFDFDFVESSNGVSTYRVKPNKGLQNKTYNFNININDGEKKLPLKITVKSSTPNPKVAFQKNQKKLNLFLKQDMTEVKMNVTNLGKDTVSEFSLEALSKSDDDKKFTENFKVDKIDGSNCVITQKSSSFIYTSKNKPAVTGYLVLKFDNYNETVEKKYKITIPTQTVAPSYKLNKTSDTYNMGATNQSIVLELLDKKNKNQIVDLNDSGYHVSIKPGSITTVKPQGISGDTCITEDGKIGLNMTKASAGKVYLVVTHDDWAPDKAFTYTYTIKTTAATPKISLSSSTITLNSYYPEQEATFTLKSNQLDTVITEEQEFTPNYAAKAKDSVKENYGKLSVTYENGEGKVAIVDESISNGTYSFVCTTQYDFKSGKEKSNRVTLKVKVNKGLPTVSVKGSAALNSKATDESGNFVEKSSLEMVSRVPDTYVIDKDKTLENIKLITKNCSEYEDRFDWDIDDDNLIVSLNRWCPDKTYSFNITPVFTNDNLEPSRSVPGKPFKVNVKVYSGEISVSLSSTGKLNLLDRSGECTKSNSIIYTPTFKNLKDTVEEAAVYDANGNVTPIYSADGSNESEFFDVMVLGGKLYVYPKADATLENNKTYKIMLWMKLKDYQAFDSSDGNGMWSKVLTVKTAQILPKVISDESDVNLYLSNKGYKAVFIIDKKDEKAIGKLSGIAFGEKDTAADTSFTLESEPLEDDSLKVTLQLKDTVSYSCNTTNKIKMYVKFEGQGENTPGTAITMNVKINK